MGGIWSRLSGDGDVPSYRESHPGLANSGIFDWFNRWSAEGTDVRDPDDVPEEEPKPEDDKEDKPPKPEDKPEKPEDDGEEKPKPEPKPEPEPEPKPKPIIKTKSVDFNIQVNTDAHRTSCYAITETEEGNVPQLIVRRGQTFDINIEFDRPYDPESDKVVLVFEFGKTPLPHKATHVEVALSKNDAEKKWGAKIVKAEENILTLRVNTPATIYVGKWKLSVDVIVKYVDKNIVYRYKDAQPFYILFNPWCEDDTVYLHDDELLKEYVLNESGHVFQGSAWWSYGKPWNFAQFQPSVLECALYLLDQSKLSVTSRGDPIIVCRRLSALVNAPNDNGILVGNWSGDYSGGTSPSKWNGSMAIIEEYMDKKRPVRFGQCWVFSAVLTTMCRTLGIPARSVTNFSSAHDTDKSLTIDTYWRMEGDDKEKIEAMSGDSVWNFHVWNDAWMARPDLPKGFGGWQAIDATPQETSDGVYCCGPASLAAIKKGEVHLPYDAGFVFAEVNADQIDWILKDGSFVKSKISKRGVGEKLSTNKPLCRRSSENVENDKEEDVTREYKHAEDSATEFSSVIRANMTGTTRDDIYDYGETDMDFELIPVGRVKYGKDFILTLKAVNKSSSERTIGGTLFANTMYYTGVTFKPVKVEHFKDVTVPAGESKEMKLEVKVHEYLDKLTDHCNFKLSCLCHVTETNQVFTKQDFLSLEKPELKFQAPEEVKKGERFKIDVSFTNPLPEKLTKCEIRLEGCGIQKPRIISQKNVNQHAEFKTRIEVIPSKKGKREIFMCFNSTQLENVTGSLSVMVKE